MTLIVDLTEREMMLAAYVGVQRAIDCRLKKRVGRADHPDDDISKHWERAIEGACGEMAVAKALRLYWEPTVNTFTSVADIAENLQVRTRSDHDMELFVRENDKDTDKFVLVTGIAPRYVIRGWLLGGEAKRREWKRGYGDRVPAYFVPRENLNGVETLFTAEAVRALDTFLSRIT